MVGKFAELALSETLGVSSVLSRHLNETQRASVAAKLANMRQGFRTDIKHSANLPEVSQTQAADMLNVSERSLRTAKKRGAWNFGTNVPKLMVSEQEI